MANLVIVGTQWGCQGKSKIVDSLVHDANDVGWRGWADRIGTSVDHENGCGSMTGV